MIKVASQEQQAVGMKLVALRRATQAGYTLLEMIITLGILVIMVSAAVPVARNMGKRAKEVELRETLRELRQGIDRYKLICTAPLGGVIYGGTLVQAISPLDRKQDDECYPPSLEVLVEGIIPYNSTRRIRFLDRLPKDPMTGKADWGLRSIQDDKDAGSWGGQNVYDVYSKSNGTALNGTKYKDW